MVDGVIYKLLLTDYIISIDLINPSVSNIFSNDSFSTIQTEKSLLSVSQFIILMIRAYVVMKHEMKPNQSSQNSHFSTKLDYLLTKCVWYKNTLFENYMQVGCFNLIVNSLDFKADFNWNYEDSIENFYLLFLLRTKNWLFTKKWFILIHSWMSQCLFMHEKVDIQIFPNWKILMGSTSKFNLLKWIQGFVT